MTECSCRYHQILNTIQSLSQKEKKNLYQKTLKLQEELGEFAEAILIHEDASGSLYKSKKSNALQEELVDILLVTLDLFFTIEPQQDQLEALLQKKSMKWKEHQK